MATIPPHLINKIYRDALAKLEREANPLSYVYDEVSVLPPRMWYGAPWVGVDSSLFATTYIKKETSMTDTIDWSGPLQTRDGYKVKLLATDLNIAGTIRTMVVAIYSEKRAGWVISSRFAAGKAGKYGPEPGDIINEPAVLTQHDLKPGDKFHFVGRSALLRPGKVTFTKVQVQGGPECGNFEGSDEPHIVYKFLISEEVVRVID